VSVLLHLRSLLKALYLHRSLIASGTVFGEQVSSGDENTTGKIDFDEEEDSGVSGSIGIGPGTGAISVSMIITLKKDKILGHESH
jgi:hypothetical protein